MRKKENYKKYRDTKKVYKESQARKRKAGFLFFSILIIYVFFFTSKIIIDKKEIASYSPIGEGIQVAYNREVVVYSATYDSSKSEFEIVLSISNNNNDGINNYFYYLIPEGKNVYQNIDVEVKYENTLITVLKVSLADFDSASLVFAPKLYSNIELIPNDAVSTLQFSNENIVRSELSEKPIKTYINVRYDFLIKKAEAEIAELDRKLEELQSKKKLFEKENQELSNNLIYYTDEEKASTEQKIKSNSSQVISIESEIEKIIKQKSDVQTKIIEIEELEKKEG